MLALQSHGPTWGHTGGRHLLPPTPSRCSLVALRSPPDITVIALPLLKTQLRAGQQAASLVSSQRPPINSSIHVTKHLIFLEDGGAGF